MPLATLVKKKMVAAKTIKRYHVSRAPYERVSESIPLVFFDYFIDKQ